jgi:Tfp pilus assembly protein PilO
LDIICMKIETTIIIGCVLAIALIMFFLILPAIDSVSALSLAITNEKERLAAANDSASRINDLNDEFRSKTDEIEKAEAALPQGQELDKLLTQLETLAAANSLIMKSVNFLEPQQKLVLAPTSAEPSGEAIFPTKNNNSSPTTQPTPESEVAASNYNVLGINLELNGGYDAFKKYLDAVENNARLLDVVSFDLVKQSGQETTATTFTFSVVMNAYYQ